MIRRRSLISFWCAFYRSIDSDGQDPTFMTIEFLRARLLAERAVSKSARAKLDGLADKVCLFLTNFVLSSETVFIG